MSMEKTAPMVAEDSAISFEGHHWVCCVSVDERTLCGEGNDDPMLEPGSISCPACLLLGSPFPVTVCPFDGGDCDRAEP